jgi:hypothetical protein
MKCKRTSDGRKFDHHTLQVMRQQAIRAVREGQTAASVAAAFGLNVRTVFSRPCKSLKALQRQGVKRKFTHPDL